MKRHWDDFKSNACQLEYLNAVLAEGDTAALVAALAAVARAQGMSRAAEEAGLGRLSLYKVLSGSGNPAFAVLVSVAAALGYSFSMRAMQTGDASKGRERCPPRCGRCGSVRRRPAC
jgi:probable addiction module antidote protein